MAIQHCTLEEEKRKTTVLHGFQKSKSSCPKDKFPLPNMDLLKDSTTGNAMFSFMDEFSGYNQIQMALRDVGKTAFKTPIGNFYYTVMPFGLKNVGTTY